MAEPFTGKRVRFLSGGQRLFIEKCIKKLDGSGVEIAASLGISQRTLNDWKREKFSMDFRIAKGLSRRASVPLPRSIKLHDRFWYVSKGAHKGGLASFKKQGGQIGDPKRRKERWREWWNTTGRYRDHKILQRFSFKRPRPSGELAEFMGIMMGDGGMSRAQVVITLHHIDDLAYSKFVIKLIRKLFGVVPGVYHIPHNSVNNIVISRSGLVDYLHEMGLPIGNKVKQQFDIPNWIKASRKYSIACARGLVDTDGSVFTHSYRVNGKLYSYKKLDFSSMSQPLRQSIHFIFKNAGLRPRFSQKKSVRIDSISDMKKYFEVFSSHNPKHLKRYAK